MISTTDYFLLLFLTGGGLLLFTATILAPILIWSTYRIILRTHSYKKVLK
ncbi:hypothetical protein GCM10007927_17770 [Sulfitobacter pacificus]|uniref:Uncharacterized protein n=1 Tax=Sulfitobacter pacificus TaxID=1499314 RepID=A0ABQ5VIS0_9RHOB|nr:hypothetical protein GCM10007927_17770 [Sulfitobacter pacificus]